MLSNIVNTLKFMSKIHSHFARVVPSWVMRLIVLAALAPAAVGAEPFVPADEQQVLERLPKPSDAAERELRSLRSRLDRERENLDLAVRLATRYVELNRAEADPRYNGYAEAALRTWWDLPEPPDSVLLLRATLLQNRHDFDGALADLARLPRHPQALLTRAVVLQVQGRFAAARRSCDRLNGLAHPLVVITCMSDADSLRGQAAESHERLAAAIEDYSEVNPGVRLWSLTALAEIALRSGDGEAAERHFREAFSLDRRNAYLLNAYADFLLDQGRASEVPELLAGETKADGSLLRLALAESALGRAELAEHVATLKARFAASRLRDDRLHLREEALFVLRLLDRPRQALGLALTNWEVQREPWDVRLVLEAALAAGAPEAAVPVLKWLEESGLEDAASLRLAHRLRGEIG